MYVLVLDLEDIIFEHKTCVKIKHMRIGVKTLEK